MRLPPSQRVGHIPCHCSSADLGRAAACRVCDNYKANVHFPTNGFFRRGSPGDYVSRRRVPFAGTSPRSSLRRAFRSAAFTDSFLLSRLLTALRRPAFARPRTGGTVCVCVAFCGASSPWRQYLRARDCPPQKSSDQSVTRPTIWSDRFSPTSQRRSGRSTPRRASLLKSTRCGIRATHAPFERSNATWKALVNGRVRRWQSSSPRSCAATA